MPCTLWIGARQNVGIAVVTVRPGNVVKCQVEMNNSQRHARRDCMGQGTGDWLPMYLLDDEWLPAVIRPVFGTYASIALEETS